MINFGAMQQEAAFVGRLLKQFGLPTNIGEAIAALARTIRDHKHFERILTEASPAERQDLYDAIRPHLRFQAMPLDKYIASAGQMAEREQLPIIGADGTLQPFKPAADVDTLKREVEGMIAAAMAKRTLTLRCHKCTAEETFYQIGDETRVGVVIRARKAGWVYNSVRDNETCPRCASGTHVITPTNQPQPDDL